MAVRSAGRKKECSGLGDRRGFKGGRVAVGGAESAHHAIMPSCPALSTRSWCDHGLHGAAARLARPGSLFPFSAASVQQSEPFPRAWRGCRNRWRTPCRCRWRTGSWRVGLRDGIETKKGPGRVANPPNPGITIPVVLHWYCTVLYCTVLYCTVHYGTYLPKVLKYRVQNDTARLAIPNQA
jgi:hypothetical protein